MTGCASTAKKKKKIPEQTGWPHSGRVMLGSVRANDTEKHSCKSRTRHRIRLWHVSPSRRPKVNEAFRARWARACLTKHELCKTNVHWKSPEHSFGLAARHKICVWPASPITYRHQRRHGRHHRLYLPNCTCMVPHIFVSWHSSHLIFGLRSHCRDTNESFDDDKLIVATRLTACLRVGFVSRPN
jgi:hypothetical protein